MTDIRAALEDWQRYAGTLGGALISMGHHVAAKHQAPHEYDAESGLACSIPACLADLANRYRAALAAASPEPVLCEHYEPGDCPICDQPAPAARADERTRLGDHP